MKLIFAMWLLASFGAQVSAGWDLSPKLRISADGKHFAASFDGNLNIGTVNGSEKKFVKAIALGDAFDWTFLGFTPDGKKLAVLMTKDYEIRYYSPAGKFLGNTPDASPRFISGSFKWLVDSRFEKGKDNNSLSLLTGKGSAPRYALSEDLEYAAFSPDDKLAAFSVYRPAKAGKKGLSSLTLMSLKTGKYLKQHTPGELGIIGHPVFSPDGKLLAFADSDSKVRVVRLSDWQFIGSVFKPGDTISAIEFSPNGSFMAVAYSGALRVYSLPDYRVVARREFDGTKSTDWVIHDLAFARDESFIAALVSTGVGEKSVNSVKFIDLKK